MMRLQVLLRGLLRGILTCGNGSNRLVQGLQKGVCFLD